MAPDGAHQGHRDNRASRKPLREAAGRGAHGTRRELVKRLAKASSAGSNLRHGYLIATLLAFVLFPASATAVPSRAELGFSPITGAGTGVTLHAPSGLAVDEANGNVFLNDGSSEGNVTDIFGAEGGTPAGVASPYQITGFVFGNEPSGVVVDNSASSPSKGVLYIVDVVHSKVKKFTRNSGSELYEPAGELTATGPAFVEPLGAAVDSDGNVYVSDYGSSSVVEFSPSGSQIGRIPTNTTVGSPSALAFDDAGDLFVEGYGDGDLYKYPANGAGEIDPAVFLQVMPSGAEGIAVNPATNDLFVGQGDNVTQFDATSLAEELRFGSGVLALDSRTRIAVNSATERIYVSNRGNKDVTVFGGITTLAGVSAEAPTNPAASTATLVGRVNPDGLAVSECKFEYGPTTAYGESLPCEGAIPADSVDHEVSGVISGLISETTYHFRVAVTNANGTNYSSDQSFVTPGAVRGLATQPASSVANVTATLNGTLDPDGEPITDCHFDYGPSTSYGESVPCAPDPGSGSGPVSVHADISSLSVETTYHFRLVASNAQGTTQGADETFQTLPAVTDLVTQGASAIGNSAATLNGTLDPDGEPITDCHFDYGPSTSYGQSVPCAPDPGSGSGPVSVHAEVTGLEEGATYHFRLQASNGFGTTLGADETLLTASPAIAETTGSQVRTANAVRFDSRLNPENGSTNYHFEYGTEGPCDANACTSTTPQSAGSGLGIVLVSQWVHGLQPDTTYHYRVVADNGNPAGASFGNDMTVTTRASDASLSHGHFPGPPGSDRAYEQVSLPDTGGNPVTGAVSIADDGNRVFYKVAGGTPISETGTFISSLFAERTSSGWHSENIYPKRNELSGTSWFAPAGRGDLSDQIAFNFNNVTSASSIWRLRPGTPPVKIYEPEHNGQLEEPLLFAHDALRVVAVMAGSLDPEHPVDPNPPSGAFGRNLYDVTSGSPRLVDVMPDGSVPACGVSQGNGSVVNIPEVGIQRASNWVSSDGTRVYFPTRGSNCSNSTQLYMHEFASEETKLLSGPPVSGPSCNAGFLKSNEEAVFFYTKTRLVTEDTAPESCNGEFGEELALDADVYRYDLATETLACLTCLMSGQAVDSSSPIVSDDGSRVYFHSPKTLYPGATEGLYRLNVTTGNLAFVAAGVNAGEEAGSGQAISPDGSVIALASESPTLNAVGGQQNGGTRQYYLYDDLDRSLNCVSCPGDGSLPAGEVELSLAQPSEGLVASGANKNALAANGIFAFVTGTALVGADQDSPSQSSGRANDAYEWRDGQQFLVTDGLTGGAGITGISANGRDIFFLQEAQLTPDALDGYARIYDARIGGGIDFPPAAKPCPLEVCQGTPKGAPEEAAPGTGSFVGPDSAHKSSQKKKKHRHVKQRHHKKHKAKNRAKNDRGALR
jgi:SMP-30/Gluconolactonase/LRE-like region